MKRNTLWISLAATALLAVPAARAVDSLSACGYHSVFLNMEEVPSGFWNWTYNEGAMWAWNQYADLYRVLASNGTWGRNSVNEFGGFPSNTDLNSQWGFNWGTALAMTCFSWPCACCQISESDVLFNPSQTWTSDLIAAEDNSSWIAYQPVVMHELGHSWGEITQNESYSYNTTSVMHAYYLGYVQSDLTVHRGDAGLIRAQYNGSATLPSITDMAVHSHYVDGTGSLVSSHVGGTYFIQGSPITVRGITIENTGSTNLSNVHIRIYLSTNRTISTGDVLIGDWSFSSFPTNAQGTYDLATSIPAALTPGTWYVGGIVTHDGYVGDSTFTSNDTTHFKQPITVASSRVDDGYENNDSSGTASTVSAPFGPTLLQACPNDDDWFRVFVNAPHGIAASISFTHANGDVDMQMFDPSLTLVDSSTGTTDSESVSVTNVLSTGYYYFRIYGFSGAANSYQLSIQNLPACGSSATQSNYGAGKSGSFGVPNLTANQPPRIGQSSLVSITNGYPGAPGILLVGTSTASIPFDKGTLLVNPTSVLAMPPLNGSGAYSFTVNHSSNPAFCGATVYFQAMMVDPGATGFHHTSQTRGLQWTVGN